MITDQHIAGFPNTRIENGGFMPVDDTISLLKRFVCCAYKVWFFPQVFHRTDVRF